MAPNPKSQPAPAPQSDGPMYPSIEAFIERASADEVQNLFGSVRDSLAGLKGPKADQAKKVKKAIEKTEELLAHLLQVREKLEADRKAAKGRR
ncbi:MAG: hypothetical protein ACYC8T_36170 [Myxococcaceae bacterium]